MKIFKTLLLACMAVMTFSCSQNYDGFTLKGNFTGEDGTMLYLSYPDSTGTYVLDSATVKLGKFEFKGGIKEPAQAILSTSRSAWEEKKYVHFFMDPAVMTISIDQSDFLQYTLTGSPTNDISASLDASRKELYAQMEELWRKINSLPDGPEKFAAKDELNLVSEQIQSINIKFMENNPNSIVSAYTLRFSLSSLEYAAAENLYNSFSHYVKNSSYGKQVALELERMLRGEPGQKARLFVRTDINGEVLDLFELNKNHYLLIDFWASWCAPCRKGNPHLIELHKKYGPKGLIIVCIGDNDSSSDEWKKAIKEDGIGIFKHVLRGLKRTENGFDRSEDLSENFGNSVLPTKYLIDKNGTILLKCTDDSKALDAKLQEIFGK